jgi:hypothetical protein
MGTMSILIFVIIWAFEVDGDTRIQGGLSLGPPDANGYGKEGWITYGGTPRRFIIMGYAGRPMSLGANNNLNLFIDKNGYVGIGTESPGEKLDVRGDIKANNIGAGDITFQKDGKSL